MLRRQRKPSWRSAVVLTSTVAMLLVAPAPSPRAQPVEADLALEIEGPSGFTPPGTVGSLWITVTNLGPGNAGEPPLFLNDVTARTRISFEEAVGVPPVAFNRRLAGDCAFTSRILDTDPDLDPIVGFIVIFDEILAWESKTCEIEFIVTPVARGEVTTSWRVTSPVVDDPSPSNNTTEVIFATQAEIPTLSPLGLLILLVAIMTASIFLLRQTVGHDQ